MGLPKIFTPFIIKKKDVSSVFYFLLLVSLAFFISGIIISIRYSWILPLILALPFLLIRGVGISILNSDYKYNITQVIYALGALIVPLITYLLVKSGELAITTGYATGFIITSTIVYLLTHKKIKEIAQRVRFKIPVIKSYASKSLVASSITLSFAFLGWIDSTILGLLSSFEKVARYNIAGPISNVITLIPISLSMFLLTRSAEEKNKRYSEGMFNRTLRLSFSFSLILAILINSFLFLLIKIFFPKYQGIEPFVMILTAGIVFFSLYNLMYTYLAGKLKPEKALWPIVIAAVLNIILDIILIPRFGLYGITIATTLAHLTAFTLLSAKMRIFRKYYLVYPLILAVPLSFYLGYAGILTIMIVIPILFLTKLIQKPDLEVVYKTIKSIFIS